MSDLDFLRCACKKCGGHIEFPKEGVGQEIECPHCKQKTELYTSPLIDPPTTKDKPRGKRLLVRLGLGLGILLVIGVIIFFIFQNRSNLKPVIKKGLKTTKVNAPEKIQEPKVAKARHNLKPSAIKVEKSSQGNLLYAVGLLENEADDQRFGVTIELDLFDNQNAKLGTATDYISVIEPRSTWRFRALITEPGTTTAKLATVKEEE